MISIFSFEMTFVNRHDVISYAVKSHELEQEFCENSAEKYVYDTERKEKLIHELKKKNIMDTRVDSMIKHDHCLFEKRCFTDEYEFNFMDILGDDPYEGGLIFNKFCLNPADVYGFQNIARYTDYFRVTKLSIHFASNADSNFSPIILKYLPPVANQEVTPLLCLQATKTATSKDGAYMSLINPECLIHMYYEPQKEIVLPHLSSTLLCSNTEHCRFDYGTLVFYTRNPNQEVTFTLYWEFDYYSGVNYINMYTEGRRDLRNAVIGTASRRLEHLCDVDDERTDVEQKKKPHK